MKFNEFPILPVLTRQKALALAEQNQNHEFESVAGSSFIWSGPPPAKHQKRSIFKSFRLLRKPSNTAGNTPSPSTPPPALPPESAIPTPSEGSEILFCAGDHTGLGVNGVYEDVELNYENAVVSDGNLENDPEYSEESSVYSSSDTVDRFSSALSEEMNDQVTQLREAVERMRTALSSQPSGTTVKLSVAFPVFRGEECEGFHEFVNKPI